MVLKEHLMRKCYSVLGGIFLFVYSSNTLIAQGNCPDVQINFIIPPVICFDPAASIVDLNVEVTGGDGTGTGLWSGPNITNTTEGFFRTTFAQPGEQKVFYTYTQGSCSYRDSATFLLARLSPPSFQVSSQRDGHLCQDSFSVVRVISAYDHNTTNLVWDLAGGIAEEQGSPDLLHVTWDTPGSKLLRLQYEQFGCLSPPIFQQIILDPTIDTPLVSCDNTLEQVVYEWVDPPFSSATVVFVISGPNGVADTVLDRYTIGNLLPGQIVQVRMITTSENTCDGNFIDPVCEPIACDGNLIDIDPIQTACISSGTTDTIDLGYSLLDTITQSTLTWSGAGVFDPTQARIVVDPSMAGQTQWVYVTFQSATCTVVDSVSFDLIPPPIADFTLPVTTCQEESVFANFTFGPVSPNSDTTLIWDFGDAQVSGDPATGTAGLSWSTTGTKIVGLALKVGACISETTFRFINVQAAPEAAVINCSPVANGILFSWQTIPGALFDVVVLEGPVGTRVSTTSYQVSGLSANQNVTIEVTTRGAGLCNTRVSTQSCTPFDCPAIGLAIAAIPEVCLDPTSAPINLSATVTGANGSGTLRWSGPMVSGATWTPDATLSGQTFFIYAEYQENTCFYLDSMEVSVPEPLVANFALDSEVCSTDTVTVEAMGNFPANANFAWGINGQITPALMGPGPHKLNWNTPGNQQVSLTVNDGPCSAQPVSRQILVSASLPEPILNCQADVDQILFTWDPIPGALEYLVDVLQGPAGNRTSDTSMLFTGLTPGQEVRIEVHLENAGRCPDSRAELSCRTPGCSDITVTIDEAPLAGGFCIGSQEDSTINLTTSIFGSTGAGILTFSGPGTTGLAGDNTWTVTPAMAGQTQILVATLTEEGCTFTDQIAVAVQQIPIADFSMLAALCPGESAAILFTGQAATGATYQWSSGNLSGPGPHVINFNQAGAAMFNLSLTVTDNLCTSPTITKSLEIFGQYPAPVISCESSLSEVIFYWPFQEVSRQEIIYTGPGNGLQTSDTSFVVSGLAPETDVNLEVRFIDDNFPCRNVSSLYGCTSRSCDPLRLDWSAPTTICQGDPVDVTFSTIGAGTGGFDVVIRYGSETNTYRGIIDGSTLSFTISGDETFTVIGAALPGNAACGVGLPAPLLVTLETPADAGVQIAFPSVCAGTDTLINLMNLLSNPSPGGQWSFVSGAEDPGTAFNASIGTVRLNDLNAGTYFFQYEIGSGGICASSSVLLEIAILSSPIAGAGPDLSLDCQFNIASLGSDVTTPGLRYLWQGPSGAILDPMAAITEITQEGTYSLQVTNPATGCSATDEVVVSASPDMLSVHTTVVPVSCYQSTDGMIIIDSIAGGSGPFTVVINGINQGNRTVFTNLAAGSYDLQITNSDGCEANVRLNLEAPIELDIQLVSDIDRDKNIIYAGDSVQLTALVNIPLDQIAKVTWLPARENPSDQSLVYMVSPVTSASFGVEITDINGCKASDRLAIVVQKSVNIFMPSAFSPNGDGSNDIFYVQADQTVRQVLHFSIYNRWGEQLFSRQNFQPNAPAEGWDGDSRSLQQPSAVYVYHIQVELMSGEIAYLQGDITLLR